MSCSDLVASLALQAFHTDLGDGGKRSPRALMAELREENLG